MKKKVTKEEEEEDDDEDDDDDDDDDEDDDEDEGKGVYKCDKIRGHKRNFLATYYLQVGIHPTLHCPRRLYKRASAFAMQFCNDM